MTLKDIYQKAKAQGRAEVCRFMRDMKRAGLRVRWYEGRNFWKGPAVSCDYLQQVLSQTKVRCNYDQLGKGYIVYPCQSLSD